MSRSYASRGGSAPIQLHAGICRSFDSRRSSTRKHCRVRAQPLKVYVASELLLVDARRFEWVSRTVEGAESSFASVIRDACPWFARTVTGWQLTFPDQGIGRRRARACASVARQPAEVARASIAVLRGASGLGLLPRYAHSLPQRIQSSPVHQSSLNFGERVDFPAVHRALSH